MNSIVAGESATLESKVKDFATTNRDAESSFLVGLGFRLRVKVEHLLLNLCDCDSVGLLPDKFSRLDKNNPIYATNKRPCIRGLVYYALSIISLYSVRL